MKLVKKSQLPNLVKGKRYDEIEELPFEALVQGYGYKNVEAFFAGDDFVCYIPEYCYDDITLELEVASCYTKADFMELALGNEALAQDLFESVDWQHPSSLLNEMEIEERKDNNE